MRDLNRYYKLLQPMFEKDFGFKSDSFYIKLEGTAYRVIAEGDNKKVNGLFCARTTDAKYLTTQQNNK